MYFFEYFFQGNNDSISVFVGFFQFFDVEIFFLLKKLFEGL